MPKFFIHRNRYAVGWLTMSRQLKLHSTRQNEANKFLFLLKPLCITYWFQCSLHTCILYIKIQCVHGNNRAIASIYNMQHGRIYTIGAHVRIRAPLVLSTPFRPLHTISSYKTIFIHIYTYHCVQAAIRSI